MMTRRKMRVAVCALFAGLVSACAAAVTPPPLSPQTGASPTGFTSAGSSTGGHLTPVAAASDSSQSTALTDYLKTHRLPLVGAQVLNKGSGNRQVVLYGFVATQFGKQDAEAKARQFLGDPNVEVTNRIDVRPELLASGNPAPSSSSAMPLYNSGTAPATGNAGTPDTSQLGSLQSYQDQQAQAQQYQQQGGSALTALLPLIGMVGMMAIGNSNFGVGMGGYPGGGYPGGGMFGSPYAPYGQPYAPYPPAGYGGYPGSSFGFGGGGYPFP